MLHKDEIFGPGSGHEMYCKKCGYAGNSYYHMTCPVSKAEKESEQLSLRNAAEAHDAVRNRVEILEIALGILSTHVANLFETDACPGDDVTIKSCDTYMNCTRCLKDWAIRQAKVAA